MMGWWALQEGETLFAWPRAVSSTWRGEIGFKPRRTRRERGLLTAEIHRAGVVEAVGGLSSTCRVEFPADGVAVGVQAVVLLRFCVELFRLLPALAGANVDSAAYRSVLLRHQHSLARLVNQALRLPSRSDLILVLKMEGRVGVDVF
jgi:hypothetical protein